MAKEACSEQQWCRLDVRWCATVSGTSQTTAGAHHSQRLQLELSHMLQNCGEGFIGLQRPRRELPWARMPFRWLAIHPPF